MTGGRRAWIGAAFGALLTLLAHPVSRPFVLGMGQHAPAGSLERCLDTQSGQPEPPRDLLGASLWVELALERVLIKDSPLRPGESETVLKIIDSAQGQDPDNAFWNQAKAATLLSAGRPLEARAAWIRASRATRWYDYQTDRLTRSQEQIERLVGTRQSWQLAYVFYHRSATSATAIERVARDFLGDADPTTSEGLTLRYATLVNGDLVRSGARSLAAGQRGANIVELTTYPADLSTVPTPRRLWTGQTEMLDRMTKLGGDWEARSDRARQIFANNEGWRALMAYEDPQNLPEWLSLLSLLTSGIAGAVAIIALGGGVIYGLGLAVERLWGNKPKLSWPAVGLIGVILGAIGAWLTSDILVGLSTALCTGLLGLAPTKIRRVRPDDLGPFFVFTVGSTAILFGLTTAAYLLGTTSAAAQLLPMLGIPPGYYHTPLLLGLSAVFLSLMLLAIPMWGLAQRIAIPHVLCLALKKFGAVLAVGGLAFGILLTPMSVYADRMIGQTLKELIGNEPLYYYFHR